MYTLEYSPESSLFFPTYLARGVLPLGFGSISLASQSEDFDLGRDRRYCNFRTDVCERSRQQSHTSQRVRSAGEELELPENGREAG